MLARRDSLSSPVQRIEIDHFEHGLMMHVLADRRNEWIEDGDSCEDVSDLLLKVIDAPVKKSRWERCHDER